MRQDKYTFTAHTQNRCPVLLDSIVIYRTTSIENRRSHIHAPIPAWKVNWARDGSVDIGTVLEYAVVRGAN